MENLVKDHQVDIYKRSEVDFSLIDWPESIPQAQKVQIMNKNRFSVDALPKPPRYSAVKPKSNSRYEGESEYFSGSKLPSIPIKKKTFY